MNNTIYNTFNFYGGVNPDLISDLQSREIISWEEGQEKMVCRVPPDIENLKPVIQLLVSAIAPSKIFLLKNELSQESENYIDLLIVVSGKCTVPFTELEPVLDLAYMKESRVCCSLHNQGSVIEGLKNGQLFYSLYFKPENMVYDDEIVKYPEINQDSLTQIKAQAKEKFEMTFEKAKDFYQLAIIPHQDYQSGILGFLLHQSAELTYRAVLRSLNGYDKKTHEIRVLKKQVRRVAAKLNTVFPDDTENEKRLLDLLESAYLDCRYGDTRFPEEADISSLIEKINQLQDLARQIVETRLAKS